MSVEKIIIKNFSQETDVFISLDHELLMKNLSYPEMGIILFICSMPDQTCTRQEIYQGSPKDPPDKIDLYLASLHKKNRISITEDTISIAGQHNGHH